jgi:large subunit ribosomal protein L25
LEQPQLTSAVRKTTGKGPARALRRNGQLPAVLYGPEIAPILLTVDVHAFEQLLKNHNINQLVLKLVIQNGPSQSKSVMVKELQVHPVTNRLIHADFYEISMTRKLWVNVPIVVEGRSVGEERGGILQVIRRELEVLCLPGEIPESIRVDIGPLDIGDAVHVEDIQLPDGVEMSADTNFTILTITSPKIEEEPEEEEEAEEAEEAEAAEAAPEVSSEE